jgi:hypothetical protein
VLVEDLGRVAHARWLVVTGRACAPIAAMVLMSPARPPAPLGSLALKLITQAGAGRFGAGIGGVSFGAGSGVGFMNGPMRGTTSATGGQPRRQPRAQSLRT